LTVLAVAMLTSALSAGFDYLYPLRIIAAAVVLWYFRQAYRPELSLPSPAAVIGGLVVFAAWLALARLGGPTGSAGDSQEALRRIGPGWAATWIAFRVLGSILIAPVVEELAFRGYLLRRLHSADWDATPPVPALIPLAVSSLLFGALHERWLAGTLTGLCYGWVYCRRGRLADAVVAHAVTNALLALIALASGDWSIWS
jgi:exosortase E/protease (VPEID-CTERM system)